MTILKIELYQRQLPKATFKSDRDYFDELDRILDELFEAAVAKGWDWSQLAIQSGLAYQTVRNLGYRWTVRPQFRTVLLIADAVDCSIKLSKKTQGKVAALKLHKAG